MSSRRCYPQDLADRVRQTWPGGGPLPDTLETILDTAYHASFLRDEERAVAFRLLVAGSNELSFEGGPPDGLLTLRFAEPRAFDEHELRRLAQAAKYHRALLAVDPALEIWGLVQSGPRWLQAAYGGRASEPPLPANLVVRVARPGHVAVACGPHAIAELRGGKLTDFRIDVFASRWLAALFADQRAELVESHRRSMPTATTDEGANEVARHVAQQMIKRVLATMRQAHHGGTLLIVPPDCLGMDYLHTKYAFRADPSRGRFRTLMGEILRELDRLSGERGRTVSTAFYREAPGRTLATLDEALFELSNLMASLADVDGAVVMTRRFEILGFGAEIAGDLPAVAEVRRAIDLEADNYVTESVDRVGTRHRSAYRLCAAVPSAIAVVVSQDGTVRWIANHRGAVTYWDHGAGDE